MELAQKMFLLAAEEMNFTKAAKRAFVTQQCLSEHISKLEKQLHTKLFLRGRHLQLTESGKALVSTLQQIQHLEENLEHRIQEIEAGEIGEVRLGISTSRARSCFRVSWKLSTKSIPKSTFPLLWGIRSATSSC